MLDSDVLFEERGWGGFVCYFSCFSANRVLKVESSSSALAL